MILVLGWSEVESSDSLKHPSDWEECISLVMLIYKGLCSSKYCMCTLACMCTCRLSFSNINQTLWYDKNNIMFSCSIILQAYGFQSNLQLQNTDY